MISISVSKFGLAVKLRKDNILIRWPFSGKSVLHSYFHNRDFNGIWEYIKFIKSKNIYPEESTGYKRILYNNSGKIAGVSFESIMGPWLAINMPHESVIILRNIDISKKGIEFWIKLSRDSVFPFIGKEFVILRCKDEDSAEEILRSIPTNFADAISFVDSSPVSYNYITKD